MEKHGEQDNLHKHFKERAFNELKELQLKGILSIEAMLYFYECSSYEYEFDTSKGAFKSKRIIRFNLN